MLAMLLMIAAVLFCFDSKLVAVAEGFNELPEEQMNTEQLIEHQGYTAQVHHVTTKDGYILAIHRIKCGRFTTNCIEPREPVLLMHGLAASSNCWVSDLHNQSLGFVLADAGYDVWLGNCRGTNSSKRHVTLSPNDRQYWDFRLRSPTRVQRVNKNRRCQQTANAMSVETHTLEASVFTHALRGTLCISPSWEEMSDYDLPATVDYIRNETSTSRIHYVGHSQGTLIAFAKLADDPKFGQKIGLFFALAPVATLGYITTPLALLAPFASTIRSVLSLSGDHSLGDVSWVLKYARPICRHHTGWLDFCQNILFFFSGVQDTAHLNRTRVPVYLAHNPADTSMKDIVHLAQMIRSKEIARYDYGFIENLNHYLSFWPPAYDLSAVRTKTVLFWSEDDAFAGTLDVGALMEKLPSSVNHLLHGFSHIDFLYALSARALIYDRIVAYLRANGRHNGTLADATD